MIVDVANLDLAALRCYAFYAASQIAIGEQYGISCNEELYEAQMHKALAYLFLAENCSENLSDDIFCAIGEFIDDAINSSLYKLRSVQDCSETVEGGILTICTTSITDVSATCSGGISINIIS